jgi:hypothetical protein
MAIDNGHHFAYDTEYGTLYLTIDDAEEREEHRMGEGRVAYSVPVVIVSTSPERINHGKHTAHLTIRKRPYTVLCEYGHWPWPVYPGTDLYWHELRTRYDGGIRNDRGTQLEYGSATERTIEGLIRSALDAFHASPDWQDWRDISERMRIERLIRREENKIGDARNAITQAEQRIAEYRAAIDKLAA